MKGSHLHFFAGAVLILAGLLLPSSALIASLRTVPPEPSEQLALGALLFKVGLVVLGVSVIVLGRLSIWRAAPALEECPSDRHPPLVLTILVGILVAATALRLYGLGSGLWYDEIVTYVKYVNLPFGEIVSTYASENQHFLYSVLAYASFSIFGESAWALRLPAVAFGAGSVWALYLLGREVSGAREALLASALLAFSYHHIWFSQNARGYTGLLFWTILSSWLFLRALGRGRPHLWLLYAAAIALGVYTHLTMLFVIAGHLVMYGLALVRRRNETWPDGWKGLLLGFYAGGVLTLQLHALVLPQMAGAIERTESTVAAWKLPLWTALELVKGLEIGFAGSVAATVALVVCAAGVVSFFRTSPSIVQLLVIPGLLGAALVVARGHHLWPRFFFFALGFGVLVVVRGAMVLGQVPGRFFGWGTVFPARVGIALCMALIVASAASVPAAYAPKQDYGGALAFVEDRREPGDAVVTVGLTIFPYRSFYKKDWEAVETVEALDSIRARARRTWLLYTLPVHLQSTAPDIMARIQREFTVVRAFYGSLGGGTVFVCRSDVLQSLTRR